jgi:hypothetical protein
LTGPHQERGVVGQVLGQHAIPGTGLGRRRLDDCQLIRVGDLDGRIDIRQYPGEAIDSGSIQRPTVNLLPHGLKNRLVVDQPAHRIGQGHLLLVAHAGTELCSRSQCRRVAL